MSTEPVKPDDFSHESVTEDEVDPRPGWSGTIKLAWVLWGVAFIVLEFGGLRDADDAWPPLTQMFKWYVPQVIGIGLCAWLLVHAIDTYIWSRRKR